MFSSQTSIDEETENQGQSPRSFIFNRLGAHTSRTSTFDRLSIARNQVSIFDRLKSDDVEAFSEKFIHMRKDKKSKETS